MPALADGTHRTLCFLHLSHANEFPILASLESMVTMELRVARDSFDAAVWRGSPDIAKTGQTREERRATGAPTRPKRVLKGQSTCPTGIRRIAYRKQNAESGVSSQE
jgi:hypothetical protein